MKEDDTISSRNQQWNKMFTIRKKLSITLPIMMLVLFIFSVVEMTVTERGLGLVVSSYSPATNYQ